MFQEHKLLQAIQALPPEKQAEVVDFVEFLIEKQKKVIPAAGAEHKKLSGPQFGSARGLISMSEDFDEPLEDFAEYM